MWNDLFLLLRVFSSTGKSLIFGRFLDKHVTQRTKNNADAPKLNVQQADLFRSAVQWFLLKRGTLLGELL
jgi:hypothetical protein